jgi:hypothetical protein
MSSNLIGGSREKYMQQISRFSFEYYDGAYEQRPLLSFLLVDGQNVQKKIHGFCIEAQYQCDGCYLVITSMDCPYEESNHFMLLDLEFNVVATANLAVPYHSFLIHRHWAISSKAIRVHYYDELFYSASIEPALFGWGKRKRIVLVHDKNFDSDPQALNAIRDEKEKKVVWQQSQDGGAAAEVRLCFHHPSHFCEKPLQTAHRQFFQTGVVSLIFSDYKAPTTKRGLVAEWLRRGLQILASQFDSGRGLQFFLNFRSCSAKTDAAGKIGIALDEPAPQTNFGLSPKSSDESRIN